MSDSSKGGLVMLLIVVIALALMAAGFAAQERALKADGERLAKEGKLTWCESAAACGVLTGMDGNYWMHLPQGAYLVVKEPRNPFDERYWTMRFLPAAFGQGCYLLTNMDALGRGTPAALMVWEGRCERVKGAAHE